MMASIWDWNLRLFAIHVQLGRDLTRARDFYLLLASIDLSWCFVEIVGGQSKRANPKPLIKMDPLISKSSDMCNGNLLNSMAYGLSRWDTDVYKKWKWERRFSLDSEKVFANINLVLENVYLREDSKSAFSVYCDCNDINN